MQKKIIKGKKGREKELISCLGEKKMLSAGRRVMDKTKSRRRRAAYTRKKKDEKTNKNPSVECKKRASRRSKGERMHQKQEEGESESSWSKGIEKSQNVPKTLFKSHCLAPCGEEGKKGLEGVNILYDCIELIGY